jgi:peptidoglycan/LPS O-acetylase OafA/YrhL
MPPKCRLPIRLKHNETMASSPSPAKQRARLTDRLTGRLTGVDLLRGLSIFFVLMNHVNMRLLFAHVPYSRALPPWLVPILVWNGQYGVQIFFAVSGFLITSTSLRRWGTLGNVRPAAFYRLRIARIAPLLLALLAVLSVMHFAGVPGYVVAAETGGLPRALIAAITFHINWLEATRGYLPGNWDILWSLSVEETFYLVFPIACLLSGRARRFGFALFLALLFALVLIGPVARWHAFAHNPVWGEYSYLGGMDAIALGCLTAILLDRVRISRAAVWFAAIASAAMLLFTLAFSDQVEALHLGKLGLDMTITGIGACLLIAVAAETARRDAGNPSKVSKILGWISAPVLLLGRNSYEIYLTHMFAVMGLFAVFVRMGKPLAWVPALFLAVIVVAALAGGAISGWYSESLNRRLRRGLREAAVSGPSIAPPPRPRR